MSFGESIDSYLRNRANAVGLNISEVCRRAKISRQTLYALNDVPAKLPTLQTVIRLADVLQVHPMRLLQLLFDRVPIHASAREPVLSDRSAFVADVTLPDGALVLAGETFTKVWELQNVGKVAWEDRYLQCMDEDVIVYTRTGETLALAPNLVPHAARVAVPLTRPGECVTISVDFTAPTQPGTVLSYWKSAFQDGSLCFPDAMGVWCKVRVSTLATSAMEIRKPVPMQS